MNKSYKTRQQLLDELQELTSRTIEAEENLRSILSGEVDGLVVSTAQGDRVFTLTGAELPYRVMVETMNEGAVTLASDGTILFCNQYFADIVKKSLERVIGTSIYQYVSSTDLQLFKALLKRGLKRNSKVELTLLAGGENSVPVFLSISPLKHTDMHGMACIVVTDLTEQKRNEEILAEGKLTTQIFNQAAEIFVLCDKEGRIIRASRSTSKHLGGNPIFQTFDEAFQLLYPDGTRFTLLSAMSDMFLHSLEVIFKHKDNWVSSFLLSANSIITDNGAIGIVVVMVDITERKRAENEIQELNSSLEQKVLLRTEELANSEERYRVLYESSHDAIMLLTPEEGFFAGNPATLRLFGFNDEKEFIACTPADLSPEIQPDGWSSVKRFQEMMKAALENGSIYFEWVLNRIDGTEFPASVLLARVISGNKTYLQATVRDISQQKNYETELLLHHEHLEQLVFERTAALQKEVAAHRKAEETITNAARQWRTTFDSLKDIICLLDTEHRIIRCNKATLAFLGKDFSDILGYSYWELIHGATSPTVECSVVRMGISLKHESMDIQIGDGYFTETAEPVFDETGVLSSIVLIIRDVTGIRKSQEEEPKLQDKILQMQKTKSPGRVPAEHLY